MLAEGECSPKAMGFKNVSELYHPIGMSGIFIYIIIIYVTTICNEKSTMDLMGTQVVRKVSTSSNPETNSKRP